MTWKPSMYANMLTVPLTDLSLSPIFRLVLLLPLSGAPHAATFNTSQSLLTRLKSLSPKAQQSTVFSGVSLNSPYGSNEDQKNPSFKT